LAINEDVLWYIKDKKVHEILFYESSKKLFLNSVKSEKYHDVYLNEKFSLKIGAFTNELSLVPNYISKKSII